MAQNTGSNPAAGSYQMTNASKTPFTQNHAKKNPMVKARVGWHPQDVQNVIHVRHVSGSQRVIVPTDTLPDRRPPHVGLRLLFRRR